MKTIKFVCITVLFILIICQSFSQTKDIKINTLTFYNTFDENVDKGIPVPPPNEVCVTYFHVNLTNNGSVIYNHIKFRLKLVLNLKNKEKTNLYVLDDGKTFYSRTHTIEMELPPGFTLESPWFEPKEELCGTYVFSMRTHEYDVNIEIIKAW